MDLRRLALVTCASADGAKTSVGTGYLVDADLLLTASHVVPADARPGSIRVRTEADAVWHTALDIAAWRDVGLDAALIRLRQPVAGIAPIAWADTAFDVNERWHSLGYPQAGVIQAGDESSWKTVGLGGTLYAGGGGGQGRRQLDLGVEDFKNVALSSGASGAPVLVGERLAGIIKQVPPNFLGERLIGLPVASLLQNPGFRITIAPPWLALDSLPKAHAWVLVVLSEAEQTGLDRSVDGALALGQDDIKSTVGGDFEMQPVQVRIAEATRSPANWLSLVRALCLAPIAIFDATDFEPAVMLALGVRSVVRRGVTITCSARRPSAKQLTQLPFNIKETKLIHHGTAFDQNDDRHPHKAIAAAIKKGWQESRSQPRYLDLPAYDGVRCPYPSKSEFDIGAVDRILVLCPFSEGYAPSWLAISGALTQRYPKRRPSRMLDLVSPRLVGQALYEGIRWARTCVVDWTDWRPNVFFEFGARLACSNVGPISLIDEAALVDAGLSAQQRRLIKMWRPTPYRVAKEGDEKDELSTDTWNHQQLLPAFARHEANAARQLPAVLLDEVPHDATYVACRSSFEWMQEGITVEPQEFLKRSLEEPFGRDPQIGGQTPILYAAENEPFNSALLISIRERWVAAWYYLANRYPKRKWKSDLALRAKVRTLANAVLAFGPQKEDTDPHLRALREKLNDVIDQLDDLDDRKT